MATPIAAALSYPKQDLFLASDAFVTGFVSGIGAGKTKVGARDIVQRYKDGDSGMCVSPNFPMFSETTWPIFLETIDELGVPHSKVQSPIPRVIFATQDGGSAELTFRTGEKPDSLRGPNKSHVWLDEASLMHEDVRKVTVGRLRRHGKLGRMTLTFTPRGRQHWTFSTFYEPVSAEVGAALLSDDTHRKVKDALIKKLRIQQIGESFYQLRKNRTLIHAHTLENPFIPESFYDEVRMDYTAALAEQELGGLFVDIQGLLFNRFNFGWCDAAPAGDDVYRVRYWDKASTTEDENPASARSAGVLLSYKKSSGMITFESVIAGRFSPLRREEIILETAERDAAKHGNTVRIVTEQEPGSGGKEQAQLTVRRLGRFPVYVDVVSGVQWRKKDKIRLPGKGKLSRWMPLAAQVEAGNVEILKERSGEDLPWDEVLDELCMAPEYAICDVVDAAAGAYNMLVKWFGYVSGKTIERAAGHRIDHAAEYGVNIATEVGGGGSVDRKGVFTR